MHSITTYAPGKLMLMGEHSVVYDLPCLVTAVDHRMKVTVRKTDDNKLTLHAPDVGVIDYQCAISDLTLNTPKPAQFVEYGVRNFFQTFKVTSGLHITSQSDFSSKFGFGSSSAITVATIKGLSELFDIHLTNKELFDLSYKTVLDIQGKGSGFDVAAAIYGGTLYFVTGGKVIEPIKVSKLPLIVGYTGIKADTTTLINKIQMKLENDPLSITTLFDDITLLVEQGKKALINSNMKLLGNLFTNNQLLLSKLGVSSPELDKLNKAVQEAGAYGAKLSGAGGGDCMIALSPPDKELEVSEAIKLAGGTHIPITTNSDGVRVE
ncbi:MAG: mevalonate kinase [bacterium]|nr:mevalonate kinase [bacterium]